ncbi:MAG TPA: GIY-YIG nuclease family protein [Candidatus Parcubacteria bacterium]|nr:GIY-YIG nuclease family protein [Candidatus Parcubacteria bacterium]
MYYVYVLYSKKLNKRYIGYCADLKRRLRYHNSGNSKFTSKGVPWNLVFYEAFISKKDAVREEKFLKSGSGRKRLEYLLENTMNLIKWRGAGVD